MTEEVKIDKQAFQDRLAHFISSWKADKRSGDALFGGAGSIIILMGKTEDATSFQKNNAMHVSGSRTEVDSTYEKILIWSASVLAPRIRVPRHALCPYYRSTLYRHNCEKRYDADVCRRRVLSSVASDIIRTAKHLEPLKGGKVLIEILVRGKDADQNTKHWEKCLDIIRGAGVCHRHDWCCNLMLTS